MGALETLRTEAAVIVGAPWSFAICIGVVAVGLWAAFNWRYGGIIAQYKDRLEARDERIKLLEAHGAGGGVAAELAALKKSLEPRRLTDDERLKLGIALMQTAGTIRIEYSPSCADAQRYASDFREVFEDRGWATQLVGVYSATLKSRTGLTVGVENLKTFDMGEAIVSEALAAASIPFDIQHIEAPANADVRLTVTTKASA